MKPDRYLKQIRYIYGNYQLKERRRELTLKFTEVYFQYSLRIDFIFLPCSRLTQHVIHEK